MPNARSSAGFRRKSRRFISTATGRARPLTKRPSATTPGFQKRPEALRLGCAARLPCNRRKGMTPVGKQQRYRESHQASTAESSLSNSSSAFRPRHAQMPRSSLRLHGNRGDCRASIRFWTNANSLNLLRGGRREIARRFGRPFRFREQCDKPLSGCEIGVESRALGKIERKLLELRFVLTKRTAFLCTPQGRIFLL
jgi:hypothetical protein